MRVNTMVVDFKLGDVEYRIELDTVAEVYLWSVYSGTEKKWEGTGANKHEALLKATCSIVLFGNW